MVVARRIRSAGPDGACGGGEERLRIGVVGCGYWGSKHVRVLHGIPEVESVVAIDQREDRLRDLKRTFPGLGMFGSLDAALDEVDALVIATPPKTHVSIAVAAMEAGKSVLVEKPLATASADARRMVSTASERSLVLMVGHTFEYNAAVWTLRDLARGGELGRIYYLDSARLNLGLYQSDVNVVWDLAPHDVSIFNYVLGAKPAVVQAWGARHGHQWLEDVAYLRLQYREPEVTANIHVSWLDPCKVRRVTVVGSSKMAVYNDLSTDERVRVFDKGVVPPGDGTALQDIPMSYRYGEIRSPYLLFEEPLSVQDREFVTCIMTGTRPRTDGQNGLDVVEVLECAEISLREGRPVQLEELSGPPEPEPQLIEVS
jgi:predicted dehydrogenase